MTTATQTREAKASIAGYQYQMLVTLKAILESNQDDNSIGIEGLEDIDLKNIESEELEATTQVKYHEETRFTSCEIKKPVCYFVKDFIKRKQEKKPTIKYILHAYFRDPNRFEEFQLTEKYLTTLRKGKPVLTDEEERLAKENLTLLNESISFELGDNIEELKKTVKHLLKNEGCHGTFSFAHTIIWEKATQKDESKRKITKAGLLRELSEQRKSTFDVWYLHDKGEEAFLKDCKQKIRALHSQDTSRLLMLSKELLSCNNETVALIKNLVLSLGNYNNFRLWTLVLDMEKESLNHLKHQLLSEDIIYNDGFENLSFKASYFQTGGVSGGKDHSFYLYKCNDRNKTNIISHQIRLISKDTFDKNQEDCLKRVNSIINITNDKLNVSVPVINISPIVLLTKLTTNVFNK
ncbi:MAG: hypothetical protein ACKO34_01800 [Vampirovibrionales bacterium]